MTNTSGDTEKTEKPEERELSLNEIRRIMDPAEDLEGDKEVFGLSHDAERKKFNEEISDSH